MSGITESADYNAVELPVPYAVFAATLRPKYEPIVHRGTVLMRRGRPVMHATGPGHQDEVWLKLLKIRHGQERLPPTEWRKRIESFRGEPAYPAQPDIRRGR